MAATPHTEAINATNGVATKVALAEVSVTNGRGAVYAERATRAGHARSVSATEVAGALVGPAILAVGSACAIQASLAADASAAWHVTSGQPRIKNGQCSERDGQSVPMAG